MRIVMEGSAVHIGGNEPESAAVSVAAPLREAGVLRTDGKYSWLEDYLVRLDGKEARSDWYAWLEPMASG